MIVIVTGSNGYLGSNISKYIRSKNRVILPKRSELYNDLFWKKLPKDDYKIIHCAAVTGWRTSQEYKDNLRILKILITFCRNRKCSILFFSSIHDSGLSPYSLDKRAQIELLEQSQVKYSILRLSHVLGGDINKRTDYFVNNFIESYLSNSLPEEINTKSFDYVELERVFKEIDFFLLDNLGQGKTLISGQISASKIWDIISNSNALSRDDIYAYLLSKII